MTADITAVIHRLVEEFGDLQPLYNDNAEIAEEDGEGFPAYLFSADLEKWVEARFREEQALVSAVLARLDAEFLAGGEDVQSWLAVGFVESLPSAGEPHADLLGLLGPQLSRLAQPPGGAS